MSNQFATNITTGITSLLQRVKAFLIGPETITALITSAIILVSLYIILKIVKNILYRALREDRPYAEQLYKIIAYSSYIVVFIIVISLFARVHEPLYIAIIVIAAVLLSNWRLIADITSYYILQAHRRLYRVGATIELPGLNIRGRITSIDPIYTKLRTSAGRQIYIPNYRLLSEPIIQLAYLQNNLSFIVKLDITSIKKNPMNEVEKIIRDALLSPRIIQKPSDIKLKVREISTSSMEFELTIPIMGSEIRPDTINRITSVLYSHLEKLNPKILLHEGYEFE